MADVPGLTDQTAPNHWLVERLRAPKPKTWPWVYHGTVGAYFHAETNARAEVLDIETDHVLYRGPKHG